MKYEISTSYYGILRWTKINLGIENLVEDNLHSCSFHC